MKPLSAQGAHGEASSAQREGVPHLGRFPLHRRTRGVAAQHSSPSRLRKPPQVLLQR